MTRRGSVLGGLAAVVAMGCGGVSSTADSGTSQPKPASVVINELAGSGGDFVELYNPGDSAFELSGFGITDAESDGGVRYSTSLRFPTGAQVPSRGWFTVFLETDCPATVSPCVRGEFGLSQAGGDLVTVLDANNATVAQQAWPPNAAPSGSSWARQSDGAETFEVQRRSPGAANAP